MKKRLRLRRFRLSEVGWMAVAALAALVLLALFQQHSFTTRIERVERTTTKLAKERVTVPVRGPRGHTGPRGPKGDDGAQGTPGVAVAGPSGKQGVPGPATTPRMGSEDGAAGSDSSGTQQPGEPGVTIADLEALRSELLQVVDRRIVDLQTIVGQLGSSVDGLLYKVNRLICPLLRC